MGIEKIALSAFRSRMFSSQSKKMFSFAKKSNIFSKNGELNKKGLALVHLTDFAPKNGIIQSAKDAVGYTRNSVHFSTNHSVVSHSMGNWVERQYSIIMPFNKTLKEKGNKIVGGIATDLYSRGSVRIPKGSVIVKYNSNIPSGKYRVCDASKIEEFKELKGIKIIETSDKNMQKVTDNVIERLGYDMHSTTAPHIWGKTYGENNGYVMIDKFNKLMKRHKMRPMLHTYTPNGRIEMICENLGFRAGNANTWAVKGKDGEIILNYKDKYLKILEDIKQHSNQYGNKAEYNIDKLIEIIKSSKTPKDAEQSILKAFNLKTLTTECNGTINEYTLYQHLIRSDIDAGVVAKVGEYLRTPSQKVEEQMIGLGTKNQLRYFSTKQLFDLGAFDAMAQAKNNEVANKLYKLI